VACIRVGIAFQAALQVTQQQCESFKDFKISIYSRLGSIGQERWEGRRKKEEENGEEGRREEDGERRKERQRGREIERDEERERLRENIVVYSIHNEIGCGPLSFSGLDSSI
jgi:hypothetical protein